MRIATTLREKGAINEGSLDEIEMLVDDDKVQLAADFLYGAIRSAFETASLGYDDAVSLAKQLNPSYRATPQEPGGTVPLDF